MTSALSRSAYESAYERLRAKLRDSRVEAGLTQVQVARMLRRPQSFISKLETRERRVDFLELQVLAHIYGKPLSYYEDETLIQGLPDSSR